MSSAKEGVAIIGGGTWGLALAGAAAKKSKDVTLVTRRAVEVTPRNVKVTSDPMEAAQRASLFVLAVPTAAIEEALRTVGPALTAEHRVVHSVRGLVGEAMAPVSEIVRRETKVRMLGALGGPLLAADLLSESPSFAVVAANHESVHSAMISAFVTPAFRIYPSIDLVGLEWSSSLVGCLAIAIGYSQQIGLGSGFIAAAITRGIHEAARIVRAAGGDGDTVLGLAGVGDLLASVSQRDRPEVLFGAALARGLTADAARAEVKLRVEAADFAPRVVRWITSRGIRAPIFTAIVHGVFSARPPEEILNELMTLPVEDAG